MVTVLPSRKMLDLWARQEFLRQPSETYACTQIDELKAIHDFAIKAFGNASERYRYRNGWRWGALLEIGKEEPGIIYIGFYLDPPERAPRRRRELVFRGCKISEFEEQLKLFLEEHNAVSIKR